MTLWWGQESILDCIVFSFPIFHSESKFLESQRPLNESGVGFGGFKNPEKGGVVYNDSERSSIFPLPTH